LELSSAMRVSYQLLGTYGPNANKLPWGWNL